MAALGHEQRPGDTGLGKVGESAMAQHSAPLNADKDARKAPIGDAPSGLRLRILGRLFGAPDSATSPEPSLWLPEVKRSSPVGERVLAAIPHGCVIPPVP